MKIVDEGLGTVANGGDSKNIAGVRSYQVDGGYEAPFMKPIDTGRGEE